MARTPKPTTTPAKRRAASRYPQKLSEELVGGIVECIRVGNHRSTAAKIAGIHPETLRLWLRRGEDVCQHISDAVEEGVEPDPIDEYDALCLGLFGALLEAEAEAEMKAVAALRKAWAGWEEKTTVTVYAPSKDGKGQRVIRRTLRTVERQDWRAAKAFLETRFRDRWSPKHDVELSGATTKTVILESVPKDLTPDGAKEWAEERARLAEGYAEGGTG